jgi:hypothetical protein
VRPHDVRTTSQVVELCVAVIRSQHATPDLVIDAAFAMVADVELNEYVLSAKSTSSSEELLLLIERHEILVDACAVAYSEFARDHATGVPGLVRALQSLRDFRSSRTK